MKTKPRHKSVSYHLIAPLRKTAYRYYRSRFDPVGQKFIFLLCPMRSGSTLLMHILCSNPEIAGYGETHIRYDCADRFVELFCHNYWAIRSIHPTRTYVIDKIVHPRLLPDPSLLKQVDARFIFLTRDAGPSIRSIKRHFAIYDDDRTVQYWNAKMDELERIADTLNTPERNCYVTYEALTKSPEKTLWRLGQHLQLCEPLDRKYKTTRFTGQRIVGDSTRRIRAGDVLEDAPPAGDPSMDRATIESCVRRLESCRERLRSACAMVIE